MSRKLVYLSGMMDGVTFEQGNEWRVKATKFLKERGFDTYNPYDGKLPSHEWEALEVHGRDIHYLDRSDIVLANLDLPPTIENSKIPFFTIGEMYLAHRDRKPLIAFTNCLAHRHGYKAIVTKNLKNLDEALEYITLFY
jgi:nucleoside 2-deoxyribosyltransferase